MSHECSWAERVSGASNVRSATGSLGPEAQSVPAARSSFMIAMTSSSYASHDVGQVVGPQSTAQPSVVSPVSHSPLPHANAAASFTLQSAAHDVHVSAPVAPAQVPSGVHCCGQK